MLLGRYVIADIEATGLGPERQMIELALITVEDDRVVDVYQTLLNPLVPLPKHIQDLTLIHPKELEAAPKFYEVAEKVSERLRGATFVAHNVAFDWPMLQSAFELLGVQLKNKTLCTLRLSQELIPGLKGYTLEEMAKFFRVKLQTHHRALPDAKAALEIFRQLMELRTEARPGQSIWFLPHHEELLKALPRQAGVLKFFDEHGKLQRLEAASDMVETFTELLQVRPRNRELLESCHTVSWEVTGSPLVAAFKRARSEKPRWRWMITLTEDEYGQLRFQKAPFRPTGSGHWFFQGHAECRRKLEQLNRELPQQRFAYREGGPTKAEVLEHNQAVERLLRETRFPAENLLLWGPGRSTGEWTYVLVRQGELVGWGHDERAPEEVLQNPDEVVRVRCGKIPTEKLVAVRYLREHREDRFKKDQWRALKEKTC